MYINVNFYSFIPLDTKDIPESVSFFVPPQIFGLFFLMSCVSFGFWMMAFIVTNGLPKHFYMVLLSSPAVWKVNIFCFRSYESCFLIPVTLNSSVHSELMDISNQFGLKKTCAECCKSLDTLVGDIQVN